MSNHVHALIENAGKSINKIVGDGKRFIAYEIVNRLQAQNEFALLDH
jgi:ribosomal protein S6